MSRARLQAAQHALEVFAVQRQQRRWRQRAHASGAHILPAAPAPGRQTFSLSGFRTGWSAEGKVKGISPAPGVLYDRRSRTLRSFGMFCSAGVLKDRGHCAQQSAGHCGGPACRSSASSPKQEPLPTRASSVPSRSL